jgi:hypothetical protein
MSVTTLTRTCITIFMAIGVVSELTLADTAALVYYLKTRLESFYHSPYLTKVFKVSQYSIGPNDIKLKFVTITSLFL